MLSSQPIDPLLSLPCDSAGSALDILQLAREHCCRASYHPAGGATCKQYIPVTHTVWVTGSAQQINAFTLALLEQRKI